MQEIFCTMLDFSALSHISRSCLVIYGQLGADYDGIEHFSVFFFYFFSPLFAFHQHCWMASSGSGKVLSRHSSLLSEAVEAKKCCMYFHIALPDAARKSFHGVVAASQESCFQQQSQGLLPAVEIAFGNVNHKDISVGHFQDKHVKLFT